MAPSDQDLSDERLLSPLQAAQRLNLRPTTLKSWRLKNWGPSYIVISRQCVRYRESDLNTWLASHRVEPAGIPEARAP
jgi:hypothetical protein